MEVFRRPATRLRRNRWWLALGMAPLLLTLVALVGTFITGDPELMRVAPLGVVFSLMLSANVWARNRSPRLEPGTVAVEAETVVFEGAPVAERAQLRQVLWRTDARFGPVVQMRRRFRPEVTLAMASADEARALVHALGFDPSQRAVSFVCLSRAFEVTTTMRTAMLMLAFGVPAALASLARVPFGDGPAAAVVTAAVFLIAIVTMAAWQLAPTRVEVGADGVLLRWLGRTDFIGFGDVVSVRSADLLQGGKTCLAVELVLKSGATRTIAVTRQGFDDTSRDLLLGRLVESLELHRSGGGGAAMAALARRGRDVPTWIAALQALGSGASAGPREAPIPAEALWRLVEDAGTDAIARAAAAVAIARSASVEDRERIRIASRSTASPKLRIALARAAEPDDEAALTEALAELEAASAGAVASRSA